MNIQNTKSVLARLLATENLDVIHQTNLSTASFDPVNRKLYLPQWKNITNDVYDLFVCHEVAHALYTPAEGWHNSIHELGMGFKSYLNVVEDCRIEKLIKMKYLGARSSMYRGYQHLVHELDFFGIKRHNIDVNTLPLIDRINIYYKSSGYDHVVFNDDEYKFIEQIDQASTFEEVLDIAKSLYQHAKDNEEDSENTINFDELSIENPYLFDDEDDQYDSGDLSQQIEIHSEETSEESEEENPFDKHFQQESNNTNDSQSEDDESSDEESSQSSQGGGHLGSSKPNLDPKSLTDQIYRIKESDIVDDLAKPIRYLTFPEPILENIIVDKDDIHYMKNVYNKSTTLTERGTDIVDAVIKKLHHDNKAFISHMVKEFEMRKKASDYKRTTVARTGVLDMTDIYKYKYSEDLFRKIGITKDGKKHGFVMVMDWSGSMSDNLFGTFQQLYVLMTFCRRVNIPFEVYAFADYNIKVEKGVDDTETIKNVDPCWHYANNNDEVCFKPVIGDLAVEDVNHPLKLIKWFDSSWSAAQFKHQLRLFTMAVCQSSSFRYGDCKFNDYVDFITDQVGIDWYGGISSELSSSKNWIPYSQLGGTPLNTTLLALPKLVEKFKVKHSVEINSVIILTDGESAGRLGVLAPSRNGYLSNVVRNLVYTRGNVVYAVDKDTKEHYQVKDEYGYCLTDLLVTYVKKKTGSHLINFFISNGGNTFQYGTYDWKEDIGTFIKRKEIAKKQMRQNGFYLGTARAYDRTFVIKGSSHLQTDDDESFTIKEGASNRAIASTLIKHNKNKNQKRILLTNFVDLVS